MPRGIDSRLEESRRVGPGSSLHQRIQGESATQNYLFGVDVGTQDDGKWTKNRPTPGSAAPIRGVVGGYETFHGSGGSLPSGVEGPIRRPVFHGAEPNAIKLAQMQENHASAMAGLMQPPPDNAPMGNLKMMDLGMGRESDGVDRPVHSWVDETIRMDKDSE